VKGSLECLLDVHVGWPSHHFLYSAVSVLLSSPSVTICRSTYVAAADNIVTEFERVDTAAAEDTYYENSSMRTHVCTD
jgi:predicted RNA polymerase sigma factor